ncbi:hypothetical protein HD554DRAFT_2173384 [Boletus coccyginus]|nr:hypothetical protein HD554DRAFT_2173384 [Boletus coccyginus]
MKFAKSDDVHGYEDEDGPRLNVEVPTFNLAQNYHSLYNLKIFELLLQELQQYCKDKNWSIKKTHSYLSEVLQN